MKSCSSPVKGQMVRTCVKVFVKPDATPGRQTLELIPATNFKPSRPSLVRTRKILLSKTRAGEIISNIPPPSHNLLYQVPPGRTVA